MPRRRDDTLDAMLATPLEQLRLHTFALNSMAVIPSTWDSTWARRNEPLHDLSVATLANNWQVVYTLSMPEEDHPFAILVYDGRQNLSPWKLYT